MKLRHVNLRASAGCLPVWGKMCRPAVRQQARAAVTQIHSEHLLYTLAAKSRLLFTNASELTAGPGEQTRSVPCFTAPQGVALSLFHLIIYAPKQTHTHHDIQTHSKAISLCAKLGKKTYNTAENLLYRQRFVVFWKMIVYVLQQWWSIACTDLRINDFLILCLLTDILHVLVCAFCFS